MKVKGRIISWPLVKAGLRHHARSPWQSLLMVFGIMLGVSVIIAIDYANESARRAFELSTESITGKATHYASFGSQGVDEYNYVSYKLSTLPYPASPIISVYISSPQLDGSTMQLLGIDPFAEIPFRSYLTPNTNEPSDNFTSILTGNNTVFISQKTAELYELEINDTIELIFSGKQTTVQIAGLLNSENSTGNAGVNGIILSDISTAQHIVGEFGKLSRIDFILPEDSETAIQNISQTFNDQTQILPMSSRTGSIEEMTKAFQTNLNALSLLALVVGVFLIYNTMTFSVIQRRELFGTLRCLGASRTDIFKMVVLEALFAGTIGGLLGIVLGITLGKSAIQLVSQTINDLFFVLSVRDVSAPITSILKGTLLGISTTVLATAAPAWEASSVPPREALKRSGLEEKSSVLLIRFAMFGIAFALIGFTLLFFGNDNLVRSFSGTFLIVIGIAILTPLLTKILMNFISPTTHKLWGAIGKLAPREVSKSISRTSIATAALMIAVSVSIGVSIMIGSFRSTVSTWLDQILLGDIYISVSGNGVSANKVTLDDRVVSIIETWPNAEQVSILRVANVDSPFGAIIINANNNDRIGENQMFLRSIGSIDGISTLIENGAILISEPLARRLDLLNLENPLTLYTNKGPKDFKIAGIYFDYSSTQGTVIMGLDHYRENWEDIGITAAAINIMPDSIIDDEVSNLNRALSPIQQLLIQPNQTLKDNTFEIFDRTFEITGALQILATLVAFIGVLSSMLSLQLEKQRQLGILRAIGLTNNQTIKLILLETGLIGLTAGVLAVPTGYLLSLILVYIINRQSFGWTLQLDIAIFPFINALGISIFAAVLAGLYPAYRIMKRNISDSVRFE